MKFVYIYFPSSITVRGKDDNDKAVPGFDGGREGGRSVKKCSRNEGLKEDRDP